MEFSTEPARQEWMTSSALQSRIGLGRSTMHQHEQGVRLQISDAKVDKEDFSKGQYYCSNTFPLILSKSFPMPPQSPLTQRPFFLLFLLLVIIIIAGMACMLMFGVASGMSAANSAHPHSHSLSLSLSLRSELEALSFSCVHIRGDRANPFIKALVRPAWSFYECNDFRRIKC